MVFSSFTGRAAVAISRAGESCVITEPVDTDGVVDGYGKTKEDSWDTVATENVVRIYQPGSDVGQARVQGGRYRTDNPVLIFTRDSAIQEGFRVTYTGSLYEVDSLTFYQSHIEGEVTAVN